MNVGLRDYAHDLLNQESFNSSQAATADRVVRPSNHRQHQADGHEQDDAEDQNNVGEGEGGGRGCRRSPEDDEDDSRTIMMLS